MLVSVVFTLLLLRKSIFKPTMETPEQNVKYVLVSLLLTLNIFQTLDSVINLLAFFNGIHELYFPANYLKFSS